MEYTKQHLSLEQQADLLVSRGLCADRGLLLEVLENVGYYRLSAYWHPMRKRTPEGVVLDEFVEGASFADVWTHYRFDRNLRLLLLDAIERIEVALRSQLAHEHTKGRSPFEYARADYFPKWMNYSDILNSSRLCGDSKNGKSQPQGIDFVDHFFSKYGDTHKHLPLWMAMGVSEFGFVAGFYQHSSRQIKDRIAAKWGLSSAVLESWLRNIRILRNTCAHHGRTWNRIFVHSPLLPRSFEDARWHYVYSEKSGRWIKPNRNTPGAPIAPGNTLAVRLFVCRYLLRHVAPHSQWHLRATELLHKFSQMGVDLHKTGLPAHWESHPVWRAESNDVAARAVSCPREAMRVNSSR